MPLHVVSLEDKYLPPIANLLAARHRLHQAHHPELSARFQDPAFALSLLEASARASNHCSVVALAGERVVGFLQGRARSDSPRSAAVFFWRPGSVSMPLAGHAVEPGFSREAYPAMYAALTPHWVAQRLLHHYVFLPAYDRSAIEVWFSLNFGPYWTFAVRDTNPLPAIDRVSAPEATVAIAAPQDRAMVLKLLDEVYRFHTIAPCYMPLSQDTAASIRANNEKEWSDPGTIHWVACDQGNVVGALALTLPADNWSDLAMGRPEHCPHIHLVCTVEEMRGRGIGTALVNATLAWAREQGYSFCSLDYHPASSASARFWEGCGFRPVRYGLLRGIDERVVSSASSNAAGRPK